MDALNITQILLPVVGFLIVYVLNGIKTEIKDIKVSVEALEKDLSKSINDIDKRVLLLEQHHEDSK